MALPVSWTENALKDYKKSSRISFRRIGHRILQQNSLILSNETLSTFPNPGIASTKEKKIRSIVLTKHNKLYYRINNDLIEVLNIFDTRQNPKQNKYD
jgi:hypothetical protein